MAKLNLRNRNEGKFFKDGRKKPANWEYRFETAKVDGKRQSVSKSGFPTKKDAEREGTKALAEYNNAGTTFDVTEISVADYMQFWVDNYCKLNVSDSTLSSYRNIIKNHINPNLGMFKLKAITSLQLQDFINQQYISGRYSKKFLSSILKVLKGAFKYANVQAKLIQTNPASDVSLPKVAKSQKEEIIVLSKEDVKRILERFEGTPHQYYAMLTAYYTGLRVSEVFGLTWDCVDFKKETITVNKNAKKIEKEGKVSDGKRIRGIRGKSTTRWYFGACKTNSSYRTIKCGKTLMKALQDYKKWQEANELEYGELYTKIYTKEEITETNRKVQRLIPMQEMEFEIPLERVYPVFIKENGGFQGTDSMKYVSKVVNFDLGIRFNFHAFRHTHATMLVESGLPIKAIADRLGHGNVRTTLETYVHTTDTMIDDVVDTFEKFGSLDNNIVRIKDAQKGRKKA